jgi:hypothetical protein
MKERTAAFGIELEGIKPENLVIFSAHTGEGVDEIKKRFAESLKNYKAD